MDAFVRESFVLETLCNVLVRHCIFGEQEHSPQGSGCGTSPPHGRFLGSSIGSLTSTRVSVCVRKPKWME